MTGGSAAGGGRRRHRLRRVAWLATAVLGLAALVFVRCASSSEDRVAKAFAGRTPPTPHTYRVLDHDIFAAEVGPRDATPVLLIHGSPGSWHDAINLLRDPQLADHLHLIAVDRPGFGRSEPGHLDTSLASQAALLAGVLEAAAPGRAAIVVGHSLGGPVAARLAMDHPRLVRGLVLVAGSIDPDLEVQHWYQKAARWPIVRALVPEDLTLANDEIRPLKAELQKMLPLWSTVRMPVIVIQGDTDGLVPAANADFAQRMLTAAPVHMMRIPKQGHLIPWERPDLMRDAILELAHRQGAPSDFDSTAAH